MTQPSDPTMKAIFSHGILTAILSLFFSLGFIHAEVRLPKIFGSHMVLQQGKPIQVWGWANPGESVTVQIGEAKQTAVANAQGEWKLSLPAMKAGGPYLMKVNGTNEIAMENIMIGEVWLCSGQSNMEMGMKMFHISPQEIAAADHPNVRLMLVENRWSERPQRDSEGTCRADRCRLGWYAHRIMDGAGRIRCRACAERRK
jgi:sialate O-acetylesterase